MSDKCIGEEVCELSQLAKRYIVVKYDDVDDGFFDCATTVARGCPLRFRVVPTSIGICIS